MVFLMFLCLAFGLGILPLYVVFGIGICHARSHGIDGCGLLLYRSPNQMHLSTIVVGAGLYARQKVRAPRH